ncbi:DUF2184 domain-containing protein [Paraburkholderia sp. BR10923]|uniref:DUF2184 domain-containing protein n=1 Tax=Paraburkholderia sp. BR10923 TaxID=3236992 RepID=UPI0034CF6C07
MKPNRTQVLRDFLSDPKLQLVDSPEALAFLVSQLAYIETEVYERLREPLDYERLVPISNEPPDWATSIDYKMKDFAGRGRRHSLKGRDLPRVDVFYAMESVPVVGGALAYAFTFEELRISGRLNIPLDTDRADACMDAYQRHMNVVGLYGEYELTGVFNNPYVPIMPAINGDWLNPATTPDQILMDVNRAITQVWTQTKRNSIVDTIVIPGPQFGHIASTPRSPNSDTTILSFLQDNNLSTVEHNIDVDFVGGPDLDEAGSGDTARMIVYERNQRNLVMYIPMPIIFHAPQVFGLETQIPAEYKYAGVHWKYPKSALYVDGL